MLNKMEIDGNTSDAPCHEQSYILSLGCLIEAQISENLLIMGDNGKEIMNALEKRITTNDSYRVYFDPISTCIGKTFQESIFNFENQNSGKCNKMTF